MKYSDGFAKHDPMYGLPEKISSRILEKTQLLAGALGDRSEYLKKMLNELGDGTPEEERADGNSVALIERMAFYECMIESMVLKLESLEERLGGKAKRN